MGAHRDPSQTSKMECFAKIVNRWKTLIICAKSPVLDVWQGVFIIDSLFKVDKNLHFFTIFNKILIREKIHIYLKNIYIYIYIYVYIKKFIQKIY